MPMKVEAACVTQKRQSAEFNSDSVNINGKILSKEALLKGYKGAGTMSGAVYFALVGSDVEGFADAAVVAFNERAAAFTPNVTEAVKIIDGYFNDSVYALGEMGRDLSELRSAVIYAGGRSVIMAKANGAGMFVYSNSALNIAETSKDLNQSTGSEYETAIYSDVSVEDIFLIVNDAVLKLITQKDIEDICKVAEGSVKKIVNLISKLALSREDTQPVSVIAVKILETDLTTAENVEGFVPDLSAFEKGLAPDDAQQTNADDLQQASADIPGEDKSEDEDETANKHHKRMKIFLVVAAVVIVIWILALLAVFLGVFSNDNPNEPDTTLFNEPGLTAETTLAEEESTTSAEEVSESTTAALPESTTARRPQNVTPSTTARVPQTNVPTASTTAAPVIATTAAVTEEPTTNTSDGGTTEATSGQPEDTTAEPTETTTAEQTTASPTEQPGEETTQLPVEEEPATAATENITD